MTAQKTEKESGLDPREYDENYYRHSLPGIEHLNNPDLLDGTLPDTIRFGNVTPGNRILDFGCGRGSLAIALAKRGCMVIGVDYSPHAVQFAQELKRKFPEEIQKRVLFQQRTMEQLNFESEFDVIILNQVYEHLRDWELEILIPKLKRALKPSGTLVVSTPNLNYIRYLFPIKRLVNLPTKTIKETLRAFRGKSKHAHSLNAFLKEIFKIRYPESEHTRLHINLQTPSSIKHSLKRRGFCVRVTCVDGHTNLVSLAARRWWGETIWASCTLPSS